MSFVINTQYDSSGNVLSQTNGETSPLITLLDEYDGDTLYVGLASVGSSLSASVWQIKKLVTSGTVTRTYLADGNYSFDNVWDNRLSLTYI